MAFTDSVVFLKWSSGATQYCFYAKVEEYHGGNEEKSASYSRSLYDGSLQRVFAPTTPRQFTATFLVDDSRPGTAFDDGAGSVSVGQISDLKAAWAADDLQCMSFEDAAYWDAEWQGPWAPLLAYDPMRGKADIPVTLVER